MELGELGEQVVIVSEKAFNELNFLGFEPTDHVEYYAKIVQEKAIKRA